MKLAYEEPVHLEAAISRSNSDNCKRCIFNPCKDPWKAAVWLYPKYCNCSLDLCKDFSNACVEELCTTTTAFVTTTAKFITACEVPISATTAVNQESDSTSILQIENREIQVKSICKLLVPG
ncbi:uncharacterized protein FN964_002893 isoform 1-T1 [Alca torda]